MKYIGDPFNDYRGWFSRLLNQAGWFDQELSDDVSIGGIVTIVGSGGGVSGGSADITFTEHGGWSAYRPVRRRRYEEVIARPRILVPVRARAEFSTAREIEAVGGARGIGHAIISRARQVDPLIIKGGESSGVALMSTVRELVATPSNVYGTGHGLIDWLDTMAEEAEDEFLLQEVA